MLVVLDTNVIVSSLLAPKGSPAEIIKRWQADEFEVATSHLLLAELEHSLNYPKVKKYFKSPQETIEALLKRFSVVVILVDPHIALDVIKRDPPDNRVLECAKAAGADYIVSGDDDLRELKAYEGIVILSPAEFITLLDIQKKKKES
jgi:putative PIN family toxin of toxin-antitoxin system